MYSQRGNSSVGRARPCQGRGREFKSRFPLHKDDSQGHPFFVAGRVGRRGRVSERWHARSSILVQAGSGGQAGSRFRHQEPSHNRSSTGIRLIFDRSLARHLLPQPSQWHPGVAKESSIGSSARPPCPQVPQWHPRVAKRSCIGSSARRPCLQPSQCHPGVAKRSCIGPSARPPCPQVPQWHPRVANCSSDRPSARRPCPQIPQWHPRVAKESSIGSSAREPCLQAAQWHPRVAKRHQTDT